MFLSSSISSSPSLSKAVFFDRDGVLNIDSGYPHRPDELEMIVGGDVAIRMANDAGYKVFIVTNQGGIALGLYDVQAMHHFNHLLTEKLQSKGGVVDGIAYCPHHPDALNPDDRNCLCRKPSPKMIVDLAVSHQLDLSASLMIGDRDSDVMAGEAAGCTSFLFSGGRLDEFLKPKLTPKSTGIGE